VFLGNSTHNLDSKGRVFIPKRIQAKLPVDADGVRRVLVCPGSGDCVALYTEAGFEALRRELSLSSFESPETLKMQRFLFNNAFEVELDSAFRLLVPESLRNMVGLHDEVVLAGVVDRVELWDSVKYNAQASGARSLFLQQGRDWAKGSNGAQAPAAQAANGTHPAAEKSGGSA
jgi:MraZ protein